MFDLSVSETIVLVSVMVVQVAAGTVAVLQLSRKSERYRPLLWPLVLTAVVLEAVLLGLRGAAIRALPLTSMFESFVFMAVVLGVLYLMLSPAIDRVWFSSIIVWIIVGMILLASPMARPAARPQAIAATPWAIAHAATMVLAAACVMFAAATSVLYLLGSYRLKRKEVMQVLGRIPNMEKLGEMNRAGILLGFVLLTIGLMIGLIMASLLQTGIVRWLTDGKVVCIIAVWGLLAGMLVLDRLAVLQDKVRAYVTIFAFALVVLAILGVTVAGVTQHEFSLDCLGVTPMWMV